MAWDLVVRVAPGFTIEQTVADLTSALRTLPPQTGPLGEIEEDQIIHAQTFADDVVGDVRPALLMLGGGVLLMLIVAGVNVANLLIARGLARRRELSVRAAIGASRVRLLRQLGTEAVVLASFGAVSARSSSPSWRSRRSSSSRRRNCHGSPGFGIDGRALAFTAGIAMLAAVLFGMLPAFQTARVEPAEALRAPDGSAAPGTRRYWLRHALVVGQIAITMLVLSTAGLLLQKLRAHAAAGRRVCRTGSLARRGGHPAFSLPRTRRSSARHGAAGGAHRHAAGRQPCHGGDHGAVRRHAGR